LRDDATKTKQKSMGEVAQADSRTDAEREECGGVLPTAEVVRAAFRVRHPKASHCLKDMPPAILTVVHPPPFVLLQLSRYKKVL